MRTLGHRLVRLFAIIIALGSVFAVASGCKTPAKSSVKSLAGQVGGTATAPTKKLKDYITIVLD